MEEIGYGYEPMYDMALNIGAKIWPTFQESTNIYTPKCVTITGAKNRLCIFTANNKGCPILVSKHNLYNLHVYEYTYLYNIRPDTENVFV